VSAMPWQELLSDQQRRLLNAACGDLSRCLTWHGFRLSKDDWRHMIAGTILGWRMMPGIDTGNGSPGMILLGGSSLDLKGQKRTDAITLAFELGDEPWTYDPTQKTAVDWCPVVRAARGIEVSDEPIF